MVQSSGITVSVRRSEDKTPYREYAVPIASQKYTGNPNEVYIEAVDGERFEVFAAIAPDFPFMNSPHIMLDFRVEDNVWSSHYRSKGVSTVGKVTQLVKKPSIVQETVKKMQDGQWKSCNFQFSRLTIDEELDQTPEDIANELDKRGLITVSIQRGEAKAREITKLVTTQQPLPTDSSSKEVVKMHKVSHAVKTVVVGPSPPPSTTIRWYPTMGEEGKPIVFTFRYRSRMSLELLKILPDIEEGESVGGTCTETAATIVQDKVRAERKLVVKLKVPKQKHQASLDQKDIAKVAECVESPSLGRSCNSDDDEHLPLAFEIKAEQTRPVRQSLSNATRELRTPHVSQPTTPQPIESKVKLEVPADGDEDEIQVVISQPAHVLPARSVSAQPATGTPALDSVARKRKLEELELQMEEIEIQKRELSVRRQMMALRNGD